MGQPKNKKCKRESFYHNEEYKQAYNLKVYLKENNFVTSEYKINIPSGEVTSILNIKNLREQDEFKDLKHILDMYNTLDELVIANSIFLKIQYVPAFTQTLKSLSIVETNLTLASLENLLLGLKDSNVNELVISTKVNVSAFNNKLRDTKLTKLSLNLNTDIKLMGNELVNSEISFVSKSGNLIRRQNLKIALMLNYIMELKPYKRIPREVFKEYFLKQNFLN